MQLAIVRGGLRLLRDGREVTIAEGCQRLLGYLAVQGGTADRSQIAGSLWPDSTQDRAGANLRTCLWRLRRTGLPLVARCGHSLRLSDSVDVDFQRLVSAAQSILEGASGESRASWRELVDAHDVLEGWSEEWLILPRERFRQVRLQALEGLALGFVEGGRYGQALECAQAALAADPLRESVQSVAIGIHIQQGNRTEALRQFHSYCRAMRNELGLPPARDLCNLVSGIGLPIDASVELESSGGPSLEANPADGLRGAVQEASHS